MEKTFDTMVEMSEKQYEIDHQNGGRKDGAAPRERGKITLKYTRQYLSHRYLTIEYNFAKSCIWPIIKWTMKIIVSDGRFSLPNKVQNIYDISENRIYDVTETKIYRTKEIQEECYSGKKKCIL